jgi:fatty acid desaturase
LDLTRGFLRRCGECPWRVFAAYVGVVAPLYALAARSPWLAPFAISPSPWDAAVPLIPTAAVAYLSYFLLLPVLILVCRRRPEFPRVFATALACGAGNVALYLLVPTRLALRPVAPEGTLLALIQRFDTPLCAIPSGHVALPAAITVAAMWAARREGAMSPWRKTATGYFVWTVALAASAVLTGQHYLIDVAAGVAFGVLAAFAAIARFGEPARIHLPSLLALAREWSVIGAAAALALAWWNPATALAAGLVIATRQHALLVLYHDAVHGLLARNKRWNDFLINAAVGVPLFLPVHLYRALHLAHHRDLGTPFDPERVLLYRGQPWRYRPLAGGALAVQLVGDLSGWNACVLAWRYARERRRGGSLRLPATRFFPELIGQYLLFAAFWVAAALLWPATALRLAALWFVPYLTLTQMLQKVRSFAEHTDESDHRNGEDARSLSWAPGLLGRLTIWPYHINYHREHHARPDLPWNRLPAAFPEVRQRRGAELRWHLWNGARR